MARLLHGVPGAMSERNERETAEAHAAWLAGQAAVRR
jgi:hypothetical protein